MSTSDFVDLSTGVIGESVVSDLLLFFNALLLPTTFIMLMPSLDFIDFCDEDLLIKLILLFFSSFFIIPAKTSASLILFLHSFRSKLSCKERNVTNKRR